MNLAREEISLEEAQKRLLDYKIQPKIIDKLVRESLDFILAEDIKALFPYPSFRRSGYDGYGIRHEDDSTFPKEFELVSNVPAGESYNQTIRKDQTVRIMTGAAVPDDVAKIIMLEQTEQLDEKHVLIKETSKYSNITPIGTEFSKGDLLLEKGTKIDAGAMSLLSAFGISECLVYKQTKVAILTTGSELLSPGEPAEYGKIYNSNQVLLQGLVEKNHGKIVYQGHIPDSLELLKEKLDELAKISNLIITSGGVSVGDYDFMAVTAQQSNNCLFNKIKMRPGSPTTAFIHQNTLVLALSGNPGACFTGFYLLAESVLQKGMGNASQLKKIKMPLREAYVKKNNFDRYLRGQYELTETGNFTVGLVGSDKSSALGNLHLTNCLFKVPHDSSLEEGTEVEVWCLPCK